MSDEDIYSLNGINSQWTLLELLKHHLVQYVSITNITSITCRYISVIYFWLTLFYFITGPHVWSQFFPILTKLYIITLFCIPLYFYFAFTSFSFSLLSLSWNFMVFSAHESRSVPNILIQSRSGYHPLLVLLRLYTFSFHNVVQSSVTGIQQQIFCIDINTYSDREKTLCKFNSKKTIFSKCLSFYWSFL